jgi:exosome complex component RRP41
MSRAEVVNAAGLRIDGRRARETRRIRCELGVLRQADGSAIFELGNTRVLAVVTGPAEARRASDAVCAVVSCEFAVAAFASPERRMRRPGDRKSAECAATIVQCFESVILRHLYPRSEIGIYIQVLQSDGGTLCGEHRRNIGRLRRFCWSVFRLGGGKIPSDSVSFL